MSKPFRPEAGPAPLIIVSHASPDWLERFHAGDRATLKQVYLQQVDTVARVVGGFVADADKENVIHEVFYKLLVNPAARASFQGGNLAAWLTTVARNQAIDYVRRHQREIPTDPAALCGLEEGGVPSDMALEAECRQLAERFCRQHLPAKWASVFEARWLRQLSQREAARELGMRRTTLAYQELRIRRLLRRFMLEAEDDLEVEDDGHEA